MRYIIANWKSNKNTTEVKEWLEIVRSSDITLPPETKIILCPSFLHLGFLKTELKTAPLPFPVELGAQNLSPYPAGTYTGEVAAEMLTGLVDYVILGHSERRQYFRETDQEIRLKVAQALKNNLTPVVAFSQLNQVELTVQGLSEKESEVILLMYEPPEAISQQIGQIGEGQAAPLEQILAMTRKVKELLPKNQILYGGSVKADNVATYFNQPELAGVVLGTASLNPQEFIKIIAHGKNQV